VAENKSSLKNAIVDIAKSLEAVFKRYNRQTRNKAWNRITSKDGEKDVARILKDPSLTVSPFAKLANQKESAGAGLRLWLDDERPMPAGFDVHVKTANEAISLIRSGGVSIVSLDHDLGENEMTGYEVAKFIEEGAFQGSLIPMEVRVHSANPVGAKNMAFCIDNAKRFWRCNEVL